MKNKIVSFFIVISLLLAIIPSYTFASAPDCTGGTITYSGGNTIHTFTSSGTLDCSGIGGGSVQVLVVGGGGGGGAVFGGGGGGGGGYQYNASVTVVPQAYTIIVGNGGIAGLHPEISEDEDGGNGENSSALGITSIGGGGGVSYGTHIGKNGGSGGGGSDYGSGGAGGTGSQGGNGGAGFSASSYPRGGGGGGASANGIDGTSTYGGNGGAGMVSLISGSSVTYAGGGGGGADIRTGSPTQGAGGAGGGGNASTGDGISGTANTGGGGGGSGASNTNDGGAGGSGVVIISYPTGSLTSPIIGSGITNMLAKFATTTTITNALLSDDGFNTTLTFGNLFMPVGSILDTITNGSLNFGTATATAMIFGRSGQTMIINSKVGISTSSPIATFSVNGDFFANTINVLADSFGIDTYSPGVLAIGSTTASSITIGHSNSVTTISGPLEIKNLKTISNCNSTASPSVCGSAPSGSVAMPTGGSTLVVNTTMVTADSQIFITEDSSLDSRLGITCNTDTGRNYSISARTAGTSFTIKSSANPTTDKACLSYFIVN